MATAAATALDTACRDVGFMQISGHGIPPSVIDEMLSATDDFFALPLATKLAASPPHPGVNRGYAALGTEAHRVASLLTEVIAEALGLAPGWFAPFTDRSTVTMRVNHYERHANDPEPDPGQMRMGAHTDYGMVTVLYADPVPGLEIVGSDGEWHSVVPRPGALLVNLGDLTAQWTNDRWRSTLHRVVPPPQDADGSALRRSVAFFFDANYDAVVECLPTCRDDDGRARYGPVFAGEHLMAKILGPRTLTPSHATDTAKERLRHV